MLKQLALRYPERTLNYGVIMQNPALHPRDRIRVNSAPVHSGLFELCSRECKQDLDLDESRIHQSGRSFKEKLDTLVTCIALRIFDRENVSTIAIAMTNTPTSVAPIASAMSPPSADALWHMEQMVMEVFCPKIVVCGFEPLPSYAENLPEEWRRSLSYLMRWPVHVISSSQPKLVISQLHSLTKAFGITIELAQAVAAFPSCRDLQLGIYGSDQHYIARLALAISQTWAFRHGLLRSRSQNQGSREYTATKALSPARVSARQAPQSPFQTQIQTVLRDTPSWMLRGLANARGPGYFQTVPRQPKQSMAWHYSWAETPSDFARTGTWFNGVCQATPSSRRLLLIHLPESFVSAVRYQHETDGTWQTADYRELLRSLYLPLRSVAWASCVFAADTLSESNVMDSSVPPTLAQYALRDYWAQISGLRTEQIHIAPSLAAALKLIATQCSALSQAALTEVSTFGNKTPDMVGGAMPSFSPGLRATQLVESVSPSPRPSRLAQASPSRSIMLTPSPSRPSLAL
ncbi:hypothetical protein H4R26_004970, partial [Coemansia thaxteri]